MSALFALVFATTAHAAPNTVSAALRTSEGEGRALLSMALIDPPEPDRVTIDPPNPDVDPPSPDADPPSPDLEIDGDVAFMTLKFDGERDVELLIGLDEKAVGLQALYLVNNERAAPTRLWEGKAVDAFLPPGPCFELIGLLRDGTEIGIDVELTVDGGLIDPGSLVGLNPQPEPPGMPAATLALDFSAFARDGAVLEVAVSITQKGEALRLE